MFTFSAANRTGAVANPRRKSAAAGLPNWADVATKSKRSSTNWKAMPSWRPNWKATVCKLDSAPDSTAT